MADKKTHHAKVISFINMKGGVGKTTLTVNIGNNLVSKNYKVLIIDMDPQFNSTQTLLLHKVILSKQNETPISKNSETEIQDEESSTNIYNQLTKENKTVLQLFESSSVVRKANIIFNIKENLDLIAGDLTLTQEITGDTANKVEVIMEFLEKNSIKEDYNYILIDCPPTWSILTHSSLFASDFYLIPSKVDFYSSIGIKLLETLIVNKITDTLTYKKMGLSLQNIGILFTLVHRNIRAEEMRIAKIKKEFSNIGFFESYLPHMPSVPTKLIVYSDSESNEKYTQLNNAIDKITEELISKTSN